MIGDIPPKIKISEINAIKNDQRLKICNPCMFTFDEIPDIQYNTSKEVKYKRKAYRQERGVDKE